MLGLYMSRFRTEQIDGKPAVMFQTPGVKIAREIHKLNLTKAAKEGNIAAFTDSRVVVRYRDWNTDKGPVWNRTLRGSTKVSDVHFHTKIAPLNISILRSS
jgi:hypothetical protein